MLFALIPFAINPLLYLNSMELNHWYIYADIYEPYRDPGDQKLVWSESSTTILYLPSFVQAVSEVERLLEHSYRRELELPNCPWHVREW
jgi:hypothetical protein